MAHTINNRYKYLKNIVQRLNFSLMNIHPESKSVLAETHHIDDDKNIWCWSEEGLSESINGYMPVTLKFIDRLKGNYIRITGKAFVEDSSAQPMETDENIDTRQSLLRIEMSQIVWYYKKTGKVKFYSC